MSVINQMLKDLDKRQGEQAENSSPLSSVAAKNSSVKIFLAVVILIVLTNVVGIFAWQLYAENQSLKSQTQQSSAAVRQINLDTTADKENSSENINVEKTKVTIDLKQETSGTKLVEELESALSEPIIEPASQPIVNNAQPITGGSKQDNPSTEYHRSKVIKQRSSKSSMTEAPEIAAKNNPDNSKPTLTISRSQLSPKALVDKKITEAERAMEVNKLEKAAALFEDVLLLLPEHEIARKQLAALWYGKKAYQDAINLLSQGIALAPNAEEMRLMAARIYFEQEQPRQALNLLSPVSSSEKVELQILLASAAVELNEHEVASAAYHKLLLLEPAVGRWWLGLAVSLDSQGQFKSASNAYHQAISKGSLSKDAVHFARQRLVELGE